MMRNYRKSTRLEGYDYSQNGAYFLTLCCQNRRSWFGKIFEGEMQLNRCGEVVFEEWNKTATIRHEVLLDEFVVMPNHFHAILVLTNNSAAATVGATWQVAPTKNATPHYDARPKGPKAGSVGAIVAQFKRTTTIRINQGMSSSGEQIWQRNFHDHIIRNENDLNTKRDYIINNPAKWADDSENPLRHA